MSRLPVVAVVGRPNIGKSTLVNRVIGARVAVVQESPGVTRDRREFEADWAGRRFLLVDTGGWEVTPHEDLAGSIREQAEAAVHAADAVVFVVDATTGISEDDAGVAALLRTAGRPVVLATNKVDNASIEPATADFWSLGLGQPVAISALHGRGIGDLLDRVVAVLPDLPDDGTPPAVPTLAIIGRPNVGKSTLMNRLTGEERVLVSPVPGTTRDPIDVTITLGDDHYRIVDTAGIRRTPRIKDSADYYSVLRARDALAEADVGLLLIDAVDGVTQQDQRIAQEAARGGAALVVLLNKWDIATSEQRVTTTGGVADRLGFVGWAPVLRISAKTGARLHRLPASIAVVLENRRRRVPTGALNRMVRGWQERHPPPVRRGRRARILYAVQAGIRPPTFVLFVSGGELGVDYLRFLENRLRDEMDFTGTPLELVPRLRKAPVRA